MQKLKLPLRIFSLLIFTAQAFAQPIIVSSPDETTAVDATTIKIMPLGDSITWGTPGENSYRRALYLQLINAGYSVDFVGSLIGGDPADFDRDNEGHPGWYALRNTETAKSMFHNLNGFLTSQQPQIVLLHIGTNDISSQLEERTAVEIAAAVRDLLDIIYAFDPSILTILTKIIDRNDSFHQKTLDFNSALQTEINSLPSGQSDKVILLDMYSTLGDWNSTYFIDDLHPNDAGNGLMANTWFNTLQNHYQPVLASPFNGAGDQPTDITLIWNAPPAANGSTVYQLQVATNNQFTAIILDDQNISSTGRLVSGLNYGQQYFWRARVLGYGWSGIQNFTTEDEPTPVELYTFIAKTKGIGVELLWQTKTEINNYGFEIERQLGDIELEIAAWEKIGFVNGNGNSSSPKEYSYTDRNLTGGSKFVYRLKQIDNDGKFTYSNEVVAEIIPNEYELFQNYPNPFNPETNINFTLPLAGRVRIEIYNIMGELVVTLLDKDMEAGLHSILFKENNLTSGTYIYRIQTKDFSQTKKMLLLK